VLQNTIETVIAQQNCTVVFPCMVSSLIFYNVILGASE